VDSSTADFVKRWFFEGEEDSVIVAQADTDAEGVAATVSELRGRERVIVLVTSCDEDSVCPSNVRECDDVTEALPWPIDKDRLAVRDDVPEPSDGLTSLENSYVADAWLVLLDSDADTSAVQVGLVVLRVFCCVALASGLLQLSVVLEVCVSDSVSSSVRGSPDTLTVVVVEDSSLKDTELLAEDVGVLLTDEVVDSVAGFVAVPAVAVSDSLFVSVRVIVEVKDVALELDDVVLTETSLLNDVVGLWSALSDADFVLVG
jgi:hypothetical protein